MGAFPRNITRVGEGERPFCPKKMKAIKWWMRITAILAIIRFFVSLPSLQRAGFISNFTPGVDFASLMPEVKALVDAYFLVGLIFGVLGVWLMLGSREPARNLNLVKLTIAIFLVAGVVFDTYALSNGTMTLVGYLISIAIHGGAALAGIALYPRRLEA